MSSFFITGVLGSGKGLVSVARCIDYLKQGRKVATNCDLFLSGYFAPESKKLLSVYPINLHFSTCKILVSVVMMLNLMRTVHLFTTKINMV